MFNRKNNSNTDQNKIGELPSFEARTDLAVEEQESFAGDGGGDKGSGASGVAPQKQSYQIDGSFDYG